MANYPSLYFGLACLNNLDNLNWCRILAVDHIQVTSIGSMTIALRWPQVFTFLDFYALMDNSGKGQTKGATDSSVLKVSLKQESRE